MESITLTKRQTEIAKYICSGMTNKQIAIRAHIEPCTVTFHLEQLKLKFHAANKAALAAKLVLQEFVTESDLKQLSFAIMMLLTIGMDSRAPDLSSPNSNDTEIVRLVRRIPQRGRRKGVLYAI